MPNIVIVVILIAVAAILAFVIHQFFPRGVEKGHISDSLLQSLAQKDPVWKKETMTEAVKTTFDILKKSYETKQSDVQTDIMTINIYRDLFKNVIPNLEKLEFIRHSSLKNMEIIQVATHRNENQSTFSVRLSLEPDKEDRDLPPAVYWTFIQSGTKWLLSEISEESLPSGYFQRK